MALKLARGDLDWDNIEAGEMEIKKNFVIAAFKKLLNKRFVTSILA